METPSVFDPAAFEDPAPAYRPLQIVHGLDRFLDAAAPLEETDPAGDWAARLNTPVELAGVERIDAQLSRLAAAGNGGIVTNVGFQDYLVSARQWDILRYGLRRACAAGHRIWLYDEKGYPSGTAGGLVSRAFPEYAALGLACYSASVEGPVEITLPLPASCRRCIGVCATQDPDIATPERIVDLQACLDEWDTLGWEVPEGTWTVLYFAERISYEGTHAQQNVSAFKQYINVLEPEAVRAFLRVTHEAYARELPPEVWDRVEAIFTDEPSLMTHYLPALPERFWGKVPVVDAPVFTDRPPMVPWTQTFLTAFGEAKGYDLRPHLYALFYSEEDEACRVRMDYYDVVTRLYVDAFFRQIRAWCRAHGIASSGHVLLEENILDHVPFQGSLFAAIREMDLPGIDMLNSNPREMLHGGSFMGKSFMAAKQVASAAHLIDASRVHSECSDWEQQNVGQCASLAERIGQANLLHALGVNQITSYFGWAQFSPEDQRRYSDVMGRLAALLSGGRHVCDVAVLYPIRTLWAHFVPLLKPMPSWQQRELRSRWLSDVPVAYDAIVKALLCSQIDLDIIDEEAITSARLADGALHVAQEAYRAVVLPPLDALRLDTARALRAFAESGGAVIATGALPRLAETRAADEELAQELAVLFGESGPGLMADLAHLPECVRQQVPADLLLDGPAPDLLYTHRVLEGRDVYFITNVSPEPLVLHPQLRARGPYQVYHTLTGKIFPAEPALTLELAGYEGLFVVSETDAIKER